MSKKKQIIRPVEKPDNDKNSTNGLVTEIKVETPTSLEREPLFQMPEIKH